MLEAKLIHCLGLTLIHFLWQGLAIGFVYAIGRWLISDTPASRYLWALFAFASLAITPLVSFFIIHSSTTMSSHEAGHQPLVVSGNQAADGVASGLEQYLPWLVALWALGLLFMSARLLLGWWQVRALRRHADYAVDDIFQGALDRMCHALHILQPVRLAFSRHVGGPVLVGVLRPVILLPASLATGLNPRQLEMVLAHELAHIKRYDHWVNLLQAFVETLFYFHPVVRWISRDLRIEREIASDEVALEVAGSRLQYAETLLQLEKMRGDRNHLVLAMADRQVSGRIRRLLRPASRQRGMAATSMAMLTLILASLTVGLYEGSRQHEMTTEAAPQQFQLVGSMTPMIAPEGERDHLYYHPSWVATMRIDNMLMQARAAREGKIRVRVPQLTPAYEIQGGELIHQPRPQYPEAAREYGLEGRVVVRFSVSPEGEVRDARVVRVYPRGYGFGSAALEAIEEWRFAPFTRDGEAIEYRISTGFAFDEPPSG